MQHHVSRAGEPRSRASHGDRFGRQSATFLVLWLFLVAATPAWPCTTFLTASGDAVAVGNSYDWSIGAGLVIINPRGLAKTALVMPGNTAAEWVSLYGSVTFNQYGREQPQSGMNEAGLVVAQMMLGETVYPEADERPAVGELQWIQYALDNFDSVSELIDAAPGLRIATFYADLHYLACDASGGCATFEYLDGELVLTSGADLVVPTLTNDTYAESVAYLAEHVGFGGELPIPTSQSSLDRFVRASALARAEVAGDLQAAAFSVLDSVYNDSSQWNLVYLPGQSRVAFRTRARPEIRTVDLSDFDLDCTAEAMMLDIDAEPTGPVGELFEPYSTEANRELVEEVIGSSLPELMVGLLATYPEGLTCTLGGEDGGPDGGADAGADAAPGEPDAGVDADASGSSPADDGCSCSAAAPRRAGRHLLLWLGAAMGMGPERPWPARTLVRR